MVIKETGLHSKNLLVKDSHLLGANSHDHHFSIKLSLTISSPQTAVDSSLASPSPDY